MTDSLHTHSTRTQPILLCLGLLAIIVAAMSIIDMFSQKPNDGGVWLLGHNEVRIIDVVPGGPADRAGLKQGDIILGIANRIVTTPVEAAKVLIQQRVGSTVPYLIQRGKDVSTRNLVLGTYRTADFQYGYYCFLGIIFFLVGLYVFLKKPRDKAVRLFYLMCLTFMLFFVCNLRRSSYYWIDLFVQNAGALSLFLLPALFLHFFLIFPQRKHLIMNHPYILYAIYALPTLLHVRFTLHQLFGLGKPFETIGVNFVNWSVLGVYLFLGIVSIIHSYIHSQSPVGKRQIKMILWGTTVGLIPFLIFGAVFVSLFHNTNYLFLGVFPMILVPVSFGYSIIKYHLMDIDVIIKGSIVYTVLTGFLLGVYLLLVNGIGRYIQNLTGVDSFIVLFLSVIVIAILFAPAREKIQSFIDRTFYRDEYTLQKTLDTMTEQMNTVVELRSLLKLIFDKTCSILNVRRAVLLVKTTDGKTFECIEWKECQENLFNTIRFDEQDIASLWDEEKNRTLTSDEIHMNDAFQALSLERKVQMMKLPMSLWVPLTTNGDFTGIMGLGEKRSGDIYSAVDRSWLTALTRRAALAIQNAKLIERVAQTREKLFHTEKLASLGQLASGVAHEIRNPLSAIQMNLQALSRQVTTTPLTQRRIQIALSEVNRLEKLVQGILTFARSSPLRLQEVNLHTVIDTALKILEKDILENKIMVHKRYATSLPSIQADRDKLIQVFLNLCLNAAQALHTEGDIEITTDIVGFSEGKMVKVSISDNGPGMEREVRKNIFCPFFTTRAEGTGLGLTNVLKYVEQHDGNIEVESRVGLGTVFSVFLPLHGMKEVR